ncbi:tRNA threonylcarbamoyl adenosine modification protein (Sua5/YciO/YrdC/YwlC family) [Lewinella aquimaris]|uniref:tRNA threonylcarbamoyl adenosine modification protein (Sua5/YciO/YrdC/YwlC family) n=1 Tax=Neolewinella aquimaris TaxID=1835722 RepID=A0A840EDP1_9BACT|nr:L-threonylcarbamoyladenylate synthase [Neolewinella aquimaris]MBB4079919.1 tRNA threonylcarbamoyl adenosine modification protein (Sua5/YciO/YrdC/YwlC family) [Neolewinella aquimaris]
MLVSINPDNPQPRLIKQMVDILEEGGVIIYPTDTVYGIGCDITNKNAVERVAQIRGIDPQKAMFSFICQDISQVTEYSATINNDIFRVMKHNLPGPFTFILKSNNRTPKVLKNRKETIGVRIIDNNIVDALVRGLGRPILTASVKHSDAVKEYYTDPHEINDAFGKRVDAVIDGGIGGNEASTIIDCTGEEALLQREGVGVLK